MLRDPTCHRSRESREQRFRARRSRCGGRVARRGRALILEGIEARVANDRITANGRPSSTPRMVGSELRASVGGPDLHAAASLTGLGGTFPVMPYEMSGALRIVDGGYELSAVEARAGRITATVEGRVGSHPMNDGTRIDASVKGQALSDLSAWGVGGALPAVPFAGSMRRDARLFVDAELRSNRSASILIAGLRRMTRRRTRGKSRARRSPCPRADGASRRSSVLVAAARRASMVR